MEALQKEKYYTYNDYLNWDDNVRCELIDGKIYMMSSPSRTHQRVSRELLYQFTSFLKGKPCEVYNAPFDVRLNADGNDDTVVQPDILVVCDPSKLDEKACKGAPDLVIEIISPSTAGYDRVLKFNKYLQAGVREYWIIEPEGKTLSCYILKKGQYVSSAYGENDIAPVHVLEGCGINLEDVFGQE